MQLSIRININTLLNIYNYVYKYKYIPVPVYLCVHLLSSPPYSNCCIPPPFLYVYMIYICITHTLYSCVKKYHIYYINISLYHVNKYIFLYANMNMHICICIYHSHPHTRSDVSLLFFSMYILNINIIRISYIHTDTDILLRYMDITKSYTNINLFLSH